MISAAQWRNAATLSLAEQYDEQDDEKHEAHATRVVPGAMQSAAELRESTKDQENDENQENHVHDGASFESSRIVTSTPSSPRVLSRPIVVDQADTIYDDIAYRPSPMTHRHTVIEGNAATVFRLDGRLDQRVPPHILRTG